MSLGLRALSLGLHALSVYRDRARGVRTASDASEANLSFSARLAAAPWRCPCCRGCCQCLPCSHGFRRAFWRVGRGGARALRQLGGCAWRTCLAACGGTSSCGASPERTRGVANSTATPHPPATLSEPPHGSCAHARHRRHLPSAAICRRVGTHCRVHALRRRPARVPAWRLKRLKQLKRLERIRRLRFGP